MSYETTERIIAIDPNSVESLLYNLTAQYGELLPDGKETIKTIGAHWDDSDKTRLRAASLQKGTIAGQVLTNGKIAFCCLWQSNLASAFDRGEIAQAQQITEKQLEELTPQPE